MSIPDEYEVKFHLYDGNEMDITEYFDQYEDIRLEKREDGSVNSKVLSYFFDGIIALIQADEHFWKQENQKAYSMYQEASRMFNRFKNSRGSNARMDFLSERMIARSNGLLKLSDAIAATDNKMKGQLFTEALEFFNEEVSLANQMAEQMSSYAAFARASFTESQILFYAALESKNTKSHEAKKSLMRARASLRQASYIDPRFATYIEIIEEELDTLTKTRILDRAKEHVDTANELISKGQFLSAKPHFVSAMSLNNRASSLAGDTGTRRNLLATATQYEAAILECDANQLFRTENDTQKASEKYEDASKLIAKGIALMGHFGSKHTLDTFNCLNEYYKAMAIQTTGLTQFDQDKFKEAKASFDQGIELFKKTVTLAKVCGNGTIVKQSEEAIADINGFLSMAEAML